MIIKHYTIDGTLCLIQNVKDVWVYPKIRASHTDKCDFFAYTEEDLNKPCKAIHFIDENTESKVLRVHEDITAYICNDDGKTIEKVVAAGN